MVTTVFNKRLVQQLSRRRRRGPKGYGLLCIVRVLVYALSCGRHSARSLHRHLRAHTKICRDLGLPSCPSRRTLNRWFRQYWRELHVLTRVLGDAYVAEARPVWTIVDSTPLADPRDLDARWGKTSRGFFRGFKLHMSCDEKRVPLRATFTTGNIHDSIPATQLLAPTPRVGGDSAYDVDEIKRAARRQGSKPIFVHNPRREGKAAKRPTPRALKRVRVCIEQLNSIVKTQVLKNVWTHVKGFAAKATLAFASVLALQALALYTQRVYGYPSLKISTLRR